MANDVVIKLRLDGDNVIVTGLGKVNAGMDTMGKSAVAAGEKTQTGMATARRGVQSISTQLEKLQSLAAGYIGFQALSALAKQATEASLSMDRMARTIEFASTSAADYAKNTDFVSTKVRELGLEITSAGTSFAKLSAAAKNTALEGAGVRSIFDAVAKASTVMGLSADDTAGSLTAIGQMISKGTVSSEELRGQLGERLPGAFQIAARAMGVTTQELGKLLEGGAIATDVFLPRFAAQMRTEMAGSVEAAADSVQANLNRVATSWTQLQATVNNSTFTNELLKGVDTALSGIDAALNAQKDEWPKLAEVVAKSMAFAADAVVALWATVQGLGREAKGIYETTALWLQKQAALVADSQLTGGKNQTAIKKQFEAEQAALDAGYNADMQRIYAGLDKFRVAVDAEVKARQDRANRLALDGRARSAIRSGDGIQAFQDEELLRTKVQLDAGKKAAKDAEDAAKEAAKALAFYNGLMDKASGYSRTYTEEQNKLALALKNGDISYEQFAVAAQEVLDGQPFMVAAKKAETKAFEDQAKATDKATVALGKYYDKLEMNNADTDQIGIDYTAATAALQEYAGLEARIMGQSAVARDDALAQYKAQRDLEAEILKIRKAGGDQATIDANIAIVTASATSRAAVESQQKYVAEWNRTYDRIESGLVDALMKGGHEGAQGVRDLLMQEIFSRPFQMIVQALISPVANAVAGAATSVAGSAAGSAGGSLLGNAVGSLAGAQAGAALSTGSGLIGQFASGFSGSASTAASLMGAEMTTAASLGSMVSAALPWVAGAMLIASLVGGGETRSGAQYSNLGVPGAVNYTEGPSGGEINGTAAQAAFIGSQAGINALLSRVGSSSSITSYTAGLESSENGKGFAGAGGVLSTGATFGDTGDLHNVNKGSKTTEQAYTQYINELRRSTLQAVQAATDIPKEMHDYLAQFDFNAMSDTAFDAVEKTFYSVLGLQEALVKLPFKQLKDLSFNAAAGLIAAADAMDTVADNGLETLGSLLSNYYDNFYSAGEKTANLTANTAASFAELGFTMPAVTTGLDDWYVGIMDATLAMDQSNPAVAQLTANLLGLGGSVATLGDTAASTQKLIDGIHTSATNTVWQMQYGMGTTQEQYGMWDVKIDDLDTQLHAATDINEIARLADEELKAIKSSWDLLSPDQQRASFEEYQQDIANVDTYVAQSGATPRDIQRADNQEFADIVAAAVEKVMEKSTNAQQAAADAQAAAAANPTPIEFKVTVVDTSASLEVDITRNGV